MKNKSTMLALKVFSVLLLLLAIMMVHLHGAEGVGFLMLGLVLAGVVFLPLVFLCLFIAILVLVASKKNKTIDEKKYMRALGISLVGSGLTWIGCYYAFGILWGCAPGPCPT